MNTISLLLLTMIAGYHVKRFTRSVCFLCNGLIFYRKKRLAKKKVDEAVCLYIVRHFGLCFTHLLCALFFGALAVVASYFVKP